MNSVEAEATSAQRSRTRSIASGRGSIGLNGFSLVWFAFVFLAILFLHCFVFVFASTDPCSDGFAPPDVIGWPTGGDDAVVALLFFHSFAFQFLFSCFFLFFLVIWKHCFFLGLQPQLVWVTCLFFFYKYLISTTVRLCRAGRSLDRNPHGGGKKSVFH